MSLLPAKYDFNCWASTTFRKRITVLQSGGTTPQDFTGYTGSMPLYLQTNLTSPVYTLTSGAGGITFGGTAGTIDLFIPESTTATFTWANALYDLIVVDASNTGDTDALLWGQFNIKGL